MRTCSFKKILYKIKNRRTVLDGELAVPCYPQSATVELNSPPRLGFVWTVSEKVVLKVWALRKGLSVNPVRTGR